MDENLWTSAEHAPAYLAEADSIPYRTEGEATLLELLPLPLSRVLDLGSGDGRLVSLIQAARPEASVVAVDFSSTMLERLRVRFSGKPGMEVIDHDLSRGDLGTFGAVVSSFAIHHLTHPRKRALYEEIYALLAPRGAFCNLDHVSSPTLSLHHQFLAQLSIRPADEDPSNKLLDVTTQVGWLREIGFVDTDCHWKWRELALLGGVKPCGRDR